LIRFPSDNYIYIVKLCAVLKNRISSPPDSSRKFGEEGRLLGGTMVASSTAVAPWLWCVLLLVAAEHAGEVEASAGDGLEQC